MKNFILLALIITVSLSLASTVYAQTDSSRYKGVNIPETAVTTFTTTDSVTTTAQTIVIDNNSVGIIEVYALAYAKDIGDGITANKIVRYKKELGTLTLGSTTDILATEADTGLSGASVSFSTASNNITIRVKGKLATTVTWRLIVKRRSVLKV